MSLSVGQLKTQVRSALSKAKAKQRDATRLGFYSPAGWEGPSEVRVDETVWRVAQARSPLAARELLSSVREGERLLLVCGVTEEDLGNDLMARFGVPRLLRANLVESLKDLFQAASIDPRILPHLALVELFADNAADQTVAPASNGHLTAELFWTHLLSRMWAMPTGTPDLIAVIRWTLDSAACQRYRDSGEEFREAASRWIEAIAGPAVCAIFRSINDPSNPAAITLGLACGVLYHPSAKSNQSISQARVRFERFLGHAPISAEDASRWAAAAAVVMNDLATQAPAETVRLSRQLDDLLQTLQATELAALSSWSQLGFDAGIAGFAKELRRFLSTAASSEGHVALIRLAESIEQNRLASHNSGRVVRVRMAVRLCAWLLVAREPESAPRSLPDAIDHYLGELSYVDWARTCLCNGDPSPELAEAFRELLQAITRRRARFNEYFAGLLAAWTPSQDPSGGLIPVHRVLADLVAPAGDNRPVLLVVLDGMSAAVFNELNADLSAQGWRSITPRGEARPRVLSAIPSVTEVARTSLLTGRLQSGGQAEELAGFAGHPELRQRSRTGPPRLFHKGQIASSEDGNLTSEVADSIGSPVRFVGVVINAIDDHLAKGDQLAVSWSAGTIRVLPSLLARARDAGRLVVLVSDHGHILDQGTQQTTGSDSDRYRKPPPAPADGEVLLYPARTGLGTQEGPLVSAWGESLRYCGRKNGYHGGASPQEMVVPFSVFSHESVVSEAWEESPNHPPHWWTGEPLAPSVPASGATHVPNTKSAASLFEPQVEETAAKLQPPAPAWLVHLLRSELFQSQRARAGRSVPTSEEVSRFLQVMMARGGKLTRPALARSLGMPELRIGGYVSQIRRILNVEGYPIVHVHEESSTVELNEALLKAQFDLTESNA